MLCIGRYLKEGPKQPVVKICNLASKKMQPELCLMENLCTRRVVGRIQQVHETCISLCLKVDLGSRCNTIVDILCFII